MYYENVRLLKKKEKKKKRKKKKGGGGGGRGELGVGVGRRLCYLMRSANISSPTPIPILMPSAVQF